MATGITSTAEMTNSVVTRYSDKYIMLAADENYQGVYAQLVQSWESVSQSGGGGSSYDFPIYGEEEWVDEGLVETEDVTPILIDDDNVSVTPSEWGNVFATTKLLQYQSRTNIPEIMAKKVTMNRIGSIDRVLRRAVTGYGATYPTQTYNLDGSAAMTSLVTSTDKVTYAFLMHLKAQAMSLGIEPYKGKFFAPIHPLLMQDLMSLTEWKTIGYYQDKDMILGGLTDNAFELAGIVFMPTRYGRIYPSAGTVAQTATAIATAAAAGSNTVVVDSGTNIVAGDYVTLGTIESETVSPSSTQETVLVTAVSTNTLTVRGDGRNSSFGLRFPHAVDEAVTEGTFVAAIPLIGMNSLIGVYGADTGKYGLTKTTIGTLDTLGRFSYYGWYWYGGVGAVQKNLLLGKVALDNKVFGVF